MLHLKKVIMIICFMFSLSQFGNASTVNLPVKAIDFKNHVIQNEDLNWFSGIYKLFFENETFNVISLWIVPPSGGEDCVQTVQKAKYIYWDIENGIVINEYSTGHTPIIFDSETITNCESIEKNGNPLILEDSYVPHGTVEGMDATYEKCLKFAVISDEENLVGGIVTEVTDEYERRYTSTYHYITFWTLNNGEKQDVRNLYEKFEGCDIYIIDLSFKHSGRYLKVKHVGDVVSVQDSWEVLYINTSLKLIDTHTFEQLPADKVAAFSPGDTYMFTEWEGEPAIVHVDSLRIAQNVSVPEPMTAAVFSPDGSKLYVATVENMIYVYDTPLTSTVGTWECYE